METGWRTLCAIPFFVAAQTTRERVMLRLLWTWILYTWGGLHRYFGIQNSMRSEFERAVHYFGRALAVDPAFYNAQLQRGILLSRELGRHDEALADFDTLLSVNEAWPEVLLNRAIACQELARFEEALQDLDAYLALPEPGDSAAEARRMAAVLREILAEQE